MCMKCPELANPTESVLVIAREGRLLVGGWKWGMGLTAKESGIFFGG